MSIVKIREALENAITGMVGLVPSVNITSSTAGSPLTFITAAPHNLLTGVSVTISGHSSTPNINGTYFFVSTGASSFTLQHGVTKAPITSVASGTGGVLTANLTAWEGGNFLPVYGVPFQKVNLMRGTPENPTYGGNFSREVGYMQVTLFYPKGLGSAAIETRAELIQSTFKRGSTFVKDSIVVNVMKKPDVQPATIIEQNIVVVVKIPYKCDVFE